MINSVPKDKLYCPIRKIWVSALPEEYVRQQWISYMLKELEFPLSALGVEKGLKQLPHLRDERRKLPLRRADLICFSPKVKPEFALYPLLLMECKANKLTSEVLSQVIGYNHFVRAFFIAAVNQKEVKVGWLDSSRGEYQFIDHLPSYPELIYSTRVLDKE